MLHVFRLQNFLESLISRIQISPHKITPIQTPFCSVYARTGKKSMLISFCFPRLHPADVQVIKQHILIKGQYLTIAVYNIHQTIARLRHVFRCVKLLTPSACFYDIAQDNRAKITSSLSGCRCSLPYGILIFTADKRIKTTRKKYHVYEFTILSGA